MKTPCWKTLRKKTFTSKTLKYKTLFDKKPCRFTYRKPFLCHKTFFSKTLSIWYGCCLVLLACPTFWTASQQVTTVVLTWNATVNSRNDSTNKKNLIYFVYTMKETNAINSLYVNTWILMNEQTGLQNQWQLHGFCTKSITCSHELL